MEARGRVVEINGASARLVCEDLERCDACGAARGCAMRLFGSSRHRSIEVAAREPGGRTLVAGDLVTVSVSGRALLRSAAIAYLPPVVGLLLGAALARWLGGPDDLAAVAGAGVGVALGAWTARSLSGLGIEPVLVRPAIPDTPDA